MTNLFKDIPPGPDPPNLLYAVVEIPMRSRNKVEYKEEEGYFFLDRVLPSPFGYPLDYGFIPQTKSEDGDALDVLIFLHESTFPGCVLEVRPIGVARMRDENGIDDKIIAVAYREPRLENIEKLDDLSEYWYRGITHFFEEYKRLNAPEKWAEILEWADLESARKIIVESIERYRELSSGSEPQ
ncbi:MAG: inorganic diphosphatase [Promethearchaeota archaeon]